MFGTLSTFIQISLWLIQHISQSNNQSHNTDPHGHQTLYIPIWVVNGGIWSLGIVHTCHIQSLAVYDKLLRPNDHC